MVPTTDVVGYWLTPLRGYCTSSRLAEQQVDGPAAADVRAGAAAVTQQVGVGAAGLFEGVGEDRQVVEGAVVVDLPGDRGYGAVVPGQPRGIDGDRAERVAEDLTKNVAMCCILRLSGREPFRGIF